MKPLVSWVAILVSAFSCLSAQAGRFDYLREVDLFKYMQVEHGGFAYFPMGADRGTSKLADNERKILRQEWSEEALSEKGLEDAAKELLRSGNHLGFMHLCLAVSHSKREHAALNMFSRLLGDDARSNFCVLYGAFVISNGTGGAVLKKDCLEIVKKIRKERLPVQVTKRYPDLANEVEVAYKKTGDR
jgi:hypothetical protein